MSMAESAYFVMSYMKKQPFAARVHKLLLCIERKLLPSMQILYSTASNKMFSSAKYSNAFATTCNGHKEYGSDWSHYKG